MIKIKGEYRFCVIEISQTLASKSGIIIVDSIGAPKPDHSHNVSCYNLLYDVPFNPDDEEESQLAFMACHTWLEHNANMTSQYVITEMFFYAPRVHAQAQPGTTAGDSQAK